MSPMARRHFARACAGCGRDFMPPNSLQQFCGRRCAAEGVTKPRPTCHVCGITVSLGAISCIAHHHAANRQRRSRQCAGCKKRYVPRSAIPDRIGKYCSRDCYRASVAVRPALIEATCAQCGANFRRTRAAIARVNRSFCGNACAKSYNVGPNNPGWRGGSDPNRGQGWRRIAEEVRERDGHRCRRCGKTQEENGQRLSVDHVIPWRAFDDEAEANDKGNLVALCRPCHSAKGRAERLWLKGDVLDMWRYQVAVAEPWRVA